jgi:hypothetical protein
MPRKAASELAVVHLASKQPRVRLAPSSTAPDEVRQLFAEIVRSVPAEHFKPSDAPLIQEYAGAVALARQAAVALAAEGPVVGGRANPWLIVQEKSVRAMAALSARLRLSPQHRADSRSAGRKADGPGRSVYEVMRDVDDE